ELELIEAIAAQAGVALESGRLFEENRQRLEELSVLHDLSRAVTGQLDRGAIVDAVRRHVARVLDARHMVVILRDAEQGELEVALRVADGVDDPREPRRYPLGEVGLMSIVLATGRALRTRGSGVAHDVNNLLAAVLGRAQLLMRRVQDPQQLQWLRVIERSALDGAQTVRRLQEFTRMRRDHPMVALDVTQIVRDALELTQSRWREEPVSRGIVIEVRTELG